MAITKLSSPPGTENDLPRHVGPFYLLMRRYVILFLIILSTSCDKKGNTNNDSADATLNRKQPRETTQYSEFDLNGIPNNWIRLTETDSSFIIFNTCDGGNKLISLIPGNGSFSMLVHGQQEDIQYTIIKAEIDGDGGVRIETKLSPSSESEYFQFAWTDKETGLGVWETTYAPGYDRLKEVFVSQENQSRYKTIDQPCIECWSQEECDEMKSRTK